jgi:hypothetical protein
MRGTESHFVWIVCEGKLLEVCIEAESQINFLIFTQYSWEKKIYLKNNNFLYLKIFSSKLFIIIAIHL